MTVWTALALSSLLLSQCDPVAATDATLPAGEYCLVPQDYNARCLQVPEEGRITGKNYPLSPTSQVRPFCGECHDSYNMLTVNTGSSPYYVIPDVGSLNVLREGQWSRWNISNCDPLLLHSSGSKIYIVCSFASTDIRIQTFIVDLEVGPPTATENTMILVGNTVSSINPKVSAFFVGDGDVHLCVAGGNTLIFYNFRTGLLSSQVSLCAYVGQVTPFRGVNGQDYILVECTDRSDSLTVTLSQAYNNKMSKFVNTSILGVHNLGKNAISPDGKFIVSWRDATCVFSRLEINSTTRSVTLNTGAIHSATFMRVQDSMVFVVAVNNPNRGLYWFDVSRALTGDMVSPINGSTAVCVSSQCSGIVPVGSHFVLATINEGTEIQFFSLFNNSHIGPKNINTVVARIGVWLAGETIHPSEVYLIPHTLITTGISFTFIVPSVLFIIVAVAISCSGWIYYRKSTRSRGEYSTNEVVHMSEQPVPNRNFSTEESRRTVPHLLQTPANDDVEGQTRSQGSVLVTGAIPRCSPKNSNNSSMTNSAAPPRHEPLGEDATSV